jgi:serine/threonine protein kinase/Tol biopolymer transport system component
MTLSVGSRLGSYEITAALGAGGMGEVYRARDSKLNRDVALKVLPEPFATDAERMARFRREAQLLASLNHPHIGAIYGFEEANGVGALVLELVEGPTLADRIARGPIPLEEVIPIARQITDACEAAHAQGIIHRDLKPSNIKLRPDGVIKVLDFGLARATETTPVNSSDASQSPTITSPSMTRAGVILGTAAYMSPEQAKGRVADKRSDVWSFGCVLFEMLTGKRVFDGEDIAETLASILTKEPDWSLLPSDTPPSIRRLLRRCLERDRKRRLADMSDVRLELDEVDADGAGPAAHFASPRRWIPWSIAGVSAVIALWLAISTVFDRPADNTRVARSSILLPSGLGGGSSLGATLALSADGRRLAFVGTDTTGHRQLWMRTLDGSSPRPLAGTDGANSPFWSPDGRWLAFVADGKLKKLDPSGGQAVTLCESALSGGAWNRDDIILFTLVNGPLAQVHASGGAPSNVTTLPAEDARHAHPFFLPDGHHFGYVAFGLGFESAVYVASINSSERTQLPLDATIFVQYAQGFLLFAQGSTLMAQRFDERRNALVGAAVPVAEQLRVDYGSRSRHFSASATGVLVFQEDPFPGFELVWYDRRGRRTGTLGNAADYSDVHLSPDGRKLLVSIAEPGTTNRDLWMFDVARGIRTRFTVSPEPETHNTWSPDGSRIVYDSLRKGHRDMFLKASDGSGDEEVLLETEFDENPIDWSPDGRFISYIRRSANTGNIWMLPLEGDRKPFPFRESSFFEIGGRFSPDGRWVAYFSNESGRAEVYVSPFSRPREKLQVSTAGGIDAVWGPDGKEIFYLSDGKLMVAAVSTDGDQFRVGEVKPMFNLQTTGPRVKYDMSPDGQRFIAVTRKRESVLAPLTLVDNWPELLGQ